MNIVSARSNPDHILSSSILIVDDTALTLQIVSDILSRQGFTSLMSACDGVDALEKIETRKPDLIVMDLLMPRMDGITLCKHLRALPEYKHTPILILTAAENQEDYDNVFAAGASDLIKKPIIPAMLISKVVEHLETLYAIEKRRNL